MNWIPCELHTHTRQSDGNFTVPELLQNAKAYGVKCIAMTDHNTAAGCLQLTPALESENVPVIRGIEWTTFFGHMVVLGDGPYVDWRTATPDSIDEKLREIRAVGLLPGIAHPFCVGSPICTGCHWQYNVHDWSLVGYIEVWSRLFPSVKCGSRQALALWTQLLDMGYRLPCSSGKDWHRLDEAGEPDSATYLGLADGAVTAENALDALRSGRSYVSMAPEILFEAELSGKRFTLGEQAPANATLRAEVKLESRKEIWGRHKVELTEARLVGRGGETLESQPLNAPGGVVFSGAHGSPWVRAEVWGTMNGIDCALAITSPIYF